MDIISSTFLYYVLLETTTPAFIMFNTYFNVFRYFHLPMNTTALWSATPNIGETATAYEIAAGKRLIVIGNFSDGSQQILYDKEL